MHFSLAAWSSPATLLSGRAREAEACGGRGGQKTPGMLGGRRQRQGNQSVPIRCSVVKAGDLGLSNICPQVRDLARYI